MKSLRRANNLVDRDIFVVAAGNNFRARKEKEDSSKRSGRNMYMENRLLIS
jgi:hypothetical protein